MTAERAAEAASDPHPLAVDTGGGRLDDAEPTADQPLVTAAVTTYDRYDSAKRAVESVLDQTYEEIELVVVEDGTGSGIGDWLDAEGIDARYIRHDANRGLAAARNTAIAASRTDYIAFLDDDDEWKPRR
ncbi:MAG: glycosyltransferase family 2 protein, partial [Natronomonas sp.]|uniref:glycosyltransferase family 2 protein n=1 Tax=Natronomonas sp. TaxID=2184060 RepID=UPI0028700723